MVRGHVPKEGSAPQHSVYHGPSAWTTCASVSPCRSVGQGGGSHPCSLPPELLAHPPQVESWNKQDQKLLEAVEKGDVGRVSALASRKTARPAKLNAVGQSAYVNPGWGDTHGGPRGGGVVDGDLSGSHLLPSSSFHLAASKGLTECLTLLLAHGAPINEKNDDGKWRTPWGHLLVYRRGGHSQV